MLSTSPPGGSGPRGFALVEAIAVAIVTAGLVTLLLIAGGETRRQARLGEDLAKLRQLGAATGTYASDHSDQFWTFSWKKGQALSQWPELNNAASDLQAAANQAVDILRRKAGMQFILPITGWYPFLTYSHLPLTEHLGGSIPNLTAVSAMDKDRLKWARDPLGFFAGLYQPAPAGGTGTNANKRWPFSASFQLNAAFVDGSPVGSRVSPATNHNNHIVPADAVLGGRPISEVAFPSQKVHLHDRTAWHFGARFPYCVHDEARLPLLFVDGSTAVRAAADANQGWLPNQPASTSFATFMYQPDVWEPPAMSLGTADPVTGYFRWTRGGLAGRDFDGPEVCTGQAGCP